MNSTQKAILVVAALIALGMLVYPPFYITIRTSDINMGYHFLLDPPSRGTNVASVNVPLLLSQWLVTAVCTGVGFFVTKGGSSQASAISFTSENVAPSQGKALFFFLGFARGIVGFLFGWQVIGLFPVLSWLQDLSAVTGNMLGLGFLKLVLAVVFGSAFFGLRALINRIHLKRFGSLHPVLQKRWAL